MAALALPFSGAAVTPTRRAPARSPRTPFLRALGWARTGEDGPPVVGGQVDHPAAPSNRAEPTRTQRRPLLDRGLEVARHPHRQLGQGQAGRGPEPVAKLAEPGEGRAGPPRRSSRSRRSSSGRRPGCAGRRRWPRRRRGSPSGSQPCFDSSAEAFTWRQTAGGSVEVGGEVVEGPEELERVDPVDHPDHRQRLPRLVPLEVADQVPADREVGQGLGLAPEFLRVVLAEVGRARPRPAGGSARAGSAWSRRPA